MDLSVAVRRTGVVILPLLAAGCIEQVLQPRDPCAAPDISRTVQIANIDKVDLLFVIDDSRSMADNAEKLSEQLPRLARTLLSGVRDLNIAVVNGDMGARGVDGCSEYGADGVFQHASESAACAATYPPVLSYLAVPDASVDQLVRDFACIANVGTEGCSRQQPLEAALKALWPASDSSTQFSGGQSHGDGENAGFLRTGPGYPSLLAVVVLSDGDDGSPFALSRYVNGLSALRPGNEGLALFSAITSVPPELVDAAARSGVDFSDVLQRDAYYDRILSDPRMQRAADNTSETSAGSPGRRYVELAKELGQRASVLSILQDDYSAAMDLISDVVDQHLDAVCLPKALSRAEGGTVACNMVWELPPERLSFDTPLDCSDRPELLSSLPGRSDAGGKRCLVKQQPALGEVPRGGEGWYYDDFSAEREGACSPRESQRVVFMPGSEPPTGVTITVECWSEGQPAGCE